MSLRKLSACLLALLVGQSASAQTPARRTPIGKKAGDVAMRTTYTSGALVSVNRSYFKGARERFDFPGVSVITQCDRNRSLQLNAATRRFLVVVSTIPPAARPAAGGTDAPQSPPQGGVISETTTLSDTGERKTMFGLEARHIKTVTVRQPDAKACDSQGSRVETDGWYVDLPDRAACPAVPTPSAPSASNGQACTDRIETRQVGDAKLGLALSTTVTTIVDDGKDIRTMAMEVTDLQVAPLDAALFDVPPGYTEVRSHQDLLPALSGSGSLADAVLGSLTEGTITLAAKKPGVLRIGIAGPINSSGRVLSLTMLRNGLISSLSKAPFEALPINGAVLADIDRDAAEKACDFILLTEIAELKTSKPGKVGGLLRRTAGDTSVPSEMHDARVEYKLYAVGSPGKPRLASAAKASSGGGFGVGSALKVAKFAGSLYLGLGTGMMMGGGMMGPYASLMGAGGGGGLKARVLNPGLGVAMSMMSQPNVGGPGTGLSTTGVPDMEDVSSQRATQTVHQALVKAGSQVAEELKKSKS
jgi:hypothetical protein